MKSLTDKAIQESLDEAVKNGYMRKLAGGRYCLTNKGKGYCECLIKNCVENKNEYKN